MILPSLVVIFILSCILVWHKIRMDTQTNIHDRNMILLQQRFMEENQNNIKTGEQVKLSEEMMRSMRQSNTVIARDIYLLFREMLGQLANKADLE